jgi:hypothetical protein
MPKYRFRCETCDSEISLYVPTSTEQLNCNGCKGAMQRQMPVLSGQEVRETIDPLTNRQWKQDQQSLLKGRKEEHYWDVEVPRLVETYSLETCLEQKWLTYNEKGELIINKPPSKR